MRIGLIPLLGGIFITLKRIGLIPLLGGIFITLKLCQVIAWSWWWVLAPLWMPVASLLAIVVIVAVSVGLFAFARALLK